MTSAPLWIIKLVFFILTGLQTRTRRRAKAKIGQQPSMEEIQEMDEE